MKASKRGRVKASFGLNVLLLVYGGEQSRDQNAVSYEQHLLCSGCVMYGSINEW